MAKCELCKDGPCIAPREDLLDLMCGKRRDIPTVAKQLGGNILATKIKGVRDAQGGRTIIRVDSLKI
jgi:hypothetical protein